MGFSNQFRISIATIVALSFFYTNSSATASEAKTSNLPAEISAKNPISIYPIVGDEIVRISDEGVPITELQEQSYAAGKALAKAFLDHEKDMKAKGQVVPQRKKPKDLWAEREKDIKERQAKYGFEQTKHFTIPGTTPEVSERIWQKSTRVKVDENGNTVYETNKEFVTISQDGVPEIIPRQTVNITLSNVAGERSPEKSRPVESSEQYERQEHQGSLDGVEKGFIDKDMHDAAEMLLRGGKNIVIDGYFSDWESAGKAVEAVRQKEMEGAHENDSRANGAASCSECVAPTKLRKLKGDAGIKEKLTHESLSFFDRNLSSILGISTACAADVRVSEIVKEGETIIDNALKGKLTDPSFDVTKNPHHDWAQAEALKLVNDLANKGKLIPEKFETLGYDVREEEWRRIAQEEAKNPTKRDTYIFISYSLGDDSLRKIMKHAAGKDNVELVMRGVPDGSNLVKGLVRIRKLASEFEPLPNVIIDPALFRAYNVKVVPTVVRVSNKRMARPKAPIVEQARNELNWSEQKREADNSRSLINPQEVDLTTFRGRTVPMMLAKVEGLDNSYWLNDKIEHGHLGDFGNMGYIYPIDEPDIVEVMQRRALKIDWAGKKQRALENFWNGQTRRFIPIHTAQNSQIRVVDPTFEVAQNIYDANGNLIHTKGEQINPLKVVPFKGAVVIFNPTVTSELAVIADLKKKFEHDTQFNTVTWIFTEIDPHKGWSQYREITSLVDAPIFILTPEIAERWSINATPSVITADNNSYQFIVEEIAPNDSSKESRK